MTFKSYFGSYVRFRVYGFVFRRQISSAQMGQSAEIPKYISPASTPVLAHTHIYML